MRCIALLTKFIIVAFSLSILGACASKSSVTPTHAGQAATNVFKPSSSTVNVVNDADKRKYQLALIYLQDGELLLADKTLKNISRKYPSLVGPIINRGIIAMKEGRWQTAEKFFSSAQAYNPSNPAVSNFLGVTYRQQGKFVDAKNVYLKAIEQDQKFSSAYLNLGILFDLYLSDYELAKKYYLKYQVLEPDDSKVSIWLMDIDRRLQASN